MEMFLVWFAGLVALFGGGLIATIFVVAFVFFCISLSFGAIIAFAKHCAIGIPFLIIIIVLLFFL